MTLNSAEGAALKSRMTHRPVLGASAKRRVEATRFPRRTNRWRRLLPVKVGPRGNAYPRSACAAAVAQISRPSTNPEAKSRLRRTPALRADALVLSANAWPLSHALPSGPCLRQGGRHSTTADRLARRGGGKLARQTLNWNHTTSPDTANAQHHTRRSPKAVGFPGSRQVHPQQRTAHDNTPLRPSPLP